MIQPSEILKLHQIKKTPGRVSIIRALQEHKGPISENEIKVSMQETYDRITFYRNIHTLCSAGIIHKIVVDNTHVRYGLNCCENNHLHSTDANKIHFHKEEHVHFYCEECEEVVCLEDIKIPNFTLPKGYEKNDSDIIIKGKCEKCSH